MKHFLYEVKHVIYDKLVTQKQQSIYLYRKQVISYENGKID